MPLISKDPTVPAAAAHDLATLANALARGSEEERWAAARTIAELPGGASTLGDALRHETSAKVREALFTSLARIGTPECVEIALPYLRSDEALLRTQAWDALAAMPDSLAPYLHALLHDPVADVRIFACELARNFPHDVALPLFCEMLDAEMEPNVCAAAVDVLAESGGFAALPALERCAERFRAIPFLSFSLGVAIDRLRAQKRTARA